MAAAKKVQERKWMCRMLNSRAVKMAGASAYVCLRLKMIQ